MSTGGSSGGGNSTVTQTTQLPAFEQQFAQGNENIAASIASTPYQPYQGALIAPMNSQQTAGLNQATTAANAYQPGLNAAQGATQGLIGQNYGYYAPQSVSPQSVSAQSITPGTVGAQNVAAQSWATPGVAGAYMNPYVMAALQPQLQQLQLQQAANQQGINTQATQAGAFGDSRQGVQSALNNFYGGLQQQDVIGQGLSQAYSSGQQAFATDAGNALTAQTANQGANLQAGLANQQAGLTAQQANQGAALQASLANQSAGLNAQEANQAAGQNAYNANASQFNAQNQMSLNAANQLGSQAVQQQTAGLTGANALYSAGQQTQNLSQEALNSAYQQFQNQQNWPLQMENIRQSALANTPYNLVNYETLPQTSSTAQNLGAFGALAGGLGSLLGGTTAQAPPIGGTAI